MNESRRAYHVELDDLRSEMVRLGAEVVEKIPRGTEVLLSGDLVAADRLIGEDDAFDEASLALEERCYRMLALQGHLQPREPLSRQRERNVKREGAATRRLVARP